MALRSWKLWRRMMQPALLLPAICPWPNWPAPPRKRWRPLVPPPCYRPEGFYVKTEKFFVVECRDFSGITKCAGSCVQRLHPPYRGDQRHPSGSGAPRGQPPPVNARATAQTAVSATEMNDAMPASLAVGYDQIDHDQNPHHSTADCAPYVLRAGAPPIMGDSLLSWPAFSHQRKYFSIPL